MGEKAARVHGPMEGTRAACGRREVIIDDTWTRVTCGDCHAARRADEAAGIRPVLRAA